ncbi:MAG: tetratricopeptide repeat protein [Acidimicrobiia bacterium]|nr:tetratricopeptide repeat protein [Acidimicrobiia bacterium]
MGPVARKEKAFLLRIPLVALAFLLAAQSNASEAQSLEDHFQKALAALQSKELEIAESHFRLVLSSSLDEVGDSCFRLGKFDQAEEAYREALRNAPFFESLLIDLGSVHLFQRRFSEGVQAIEQLLSLAPPSAGFVSGQSESVNEVRESVTMAEIQLPARLVLAKLYFMQGNYGKATTELERAQQIESGNEAIAYTLGLAYLKQQPEKATPIFDRMLQSSKDQSRMRVARGRAYLETGHQDQALLELQQAAQVKPVFALSQYYLGLAYLLEGDVAAGIAALREGLKATPNHYSTHLYLGFSVAMSGKAAEAIRYLSSAVQLNPADPLGHFFLGQIRYQVGDASEAIASLGRVMPLLAERVKTKAEADEASLLLASAAYYELGRALMQQNPLSSEGKDNLQAAEELMQRSGRGHLKTVALSNVLLPEHTQFNLDTLRKILWASRTPVMLDREIPDAKTTAALNETVKSRADLAARARQALNALPVEREKPLDNSGQPSEQSLLQALSAHPESASTLLLLAKLTRRQGDPARSAKALQYLQQARALAPYCPSLLFEFAYTSLLAAAPRETAIALLKRLHLMQPDHPEALFTLAQALTVRQNSDELAEALQHFRRYVQLRPEAAEGHGFLGYCAFLTKDYDLAETHLRRSLELNRNQTAPYFYQGMIAFERGEDQKSRELLSQVLKMQPNHGMARLGSGKLYYRSQDYRNALVELQKAATLIPNMPEVYYQLSLAYRQLGEAEKSREAMQVYEKLQRAAH